MGLQQQTFWKKEIGVCWLRKKTWLYFTFQLIHDDGDYYNDHEDDEDDNNDSNNDNNDVDEDGSNIVFDDKRHNIKSPLSRCSMCI